MNGPGEASKDRTTCFQQATELEDKCTRINGVIDNLTERLKPIRIEETSKPETDNKPNLGNSSPLCEKLYELNIQLSRIEDRIIDLKDSIDL